MKTRAYEDEQTRAPGGFLIGSGPIASLPRDSLVVRICHAILKERLCSRLPTMDVKIIQNLLADDESKEWVSSTAQVGSVPRHHEKRFPTAGYICRNFGNQPVFQ
jgi:hypothetical protein